MQKLKIDKPNEDLLEKNFITALKKYIRMILID